MGGLSPMLKVPLYAILGTSVAFALTFSVVDLVNYILGFLQVAIAKPFVESAAQVYMVLTTALIMGGLFGLIFGIMDVGILLGVIISLIVNCTLVEISISSFFSLYFGILFIVVGGIILWRIFSQEIG